MHDKKGGATMAYPPVLSLILQAGIKDKTQEIGGC